MAKFWRTVENNYLYFRTEICFVFCTFIHVNRLSVSIKRSFYTNFKLFFLYTSFIFPVLVSLARSYTVFLTNLFRHILYLFFAFAYIRFIVRTWIGTVIYYGQKNVFLQINMLSVNTSIWRIAFMLHFILIFRT